MNVALLTAAGSGTRMHTEIPKQFMHIYDKPIIVYTMEAFERHPGIEAILVVCLPGWSEILRAYARQYGIQKLKWIVDGGATGQASILNGLMALKECLKPEDVVLVHDGNRPMVSQDIISDSLTKQVLHGSAVAAIPCVEAVFRSRDGASSDETIPREQLWRTQTPHAYALGKLLWAHEQAAARGIKNTAASCSLMNALGETIYLSMGSEKNIKITTPDDIDIFKALLRTSGEGYV